MDKLSGVSDNPVGEKLIVNEVSLREADIPDGFRPVKLVGRGLAEHFVPDVKPEGFLHGADKDACPGSVGHRKIVPVRFADNALRNVYFFRHQAVKIVVKIRVEVVIAVHKAHIFSPGLL